PAQRHKPALALLGQHGRDASPAERAEAEVRVGEAARALGDAAGAEAAFGRARAADAASVALAVALGDRALYEGHEDDALARYKAALTAPSWAPRTPALQFARIAALIAAGRVAEATSALQAAERTNAGDARGPYWRGQLAERTPSADLSVAEQAYQEALA